MFQILTLTLSLSSMEPCDPQDLSCLKHQLADRILEVESLGRQLATSQAQTRTTQEMVQVWQDYAAKAHTATKEAISGLKPAWYKEPVLWFAVGFTVAAAIVVAVVYAVVPAFKAATQ